MYYDAEKELHYGKRFLCEVTTDKLVSFITESEGSYLDAVSTAYKPRFRVVYNKLLKATKNLPDTIVEMEEFIDVKGLKSQGNQVTKLKVKEIILDHESDEHWPEPEEPDHPELEITDEGEDTVTMEWDMIRKKEDENPDQATLF